MRPIIALDGAEETAAERARLVVEHAAMRGVERRRARAVRPRSARAAPPLAPWPCSTSMPSRRASCADARMACRDRRGRGCAASAGDGCRARRRARGAAASRRSGRPTVRLSTTTPICVAAPGQILGEIVDVAEQAADRARAGPAGCAAAAAGPPAHCQRSAMTIVSPGQIGKSRSTPLCTRLSPSRR